MISRDRLHELMVEFRNRSSVPALGAAVVFRTGEVVIDAIGTRRNSGSDPVAIDDQWHIGSCAKSMTAALYARLVERGDAQWGVAIGDLFPDLADDLDTGWSQPTIDEVLVCRSGMKANLTWARMLSASNDTSPMTEQRSRAVVTALSRPPRSHGAFRYSNLGYVVAGAAIDRITGMPFEDALDIHLFRPLGITSAGFGPPPDIWGHKPRLQVANSALGRSSPRSPDSFRSDNPAVLTPAGRIHLNLADWAKFQHLFLIQGGDVLRPETIEHLLTAPEGKGKGMAMGWGVAGGDRGVSFGMKGSNTLWAASALIDADMERTVLVVANDGRTRLLGQSVQLAVSILRA